jgi:Skp family chaperone for outer membrane proteins
MKGMHMTSMTRQYSAAASHARNAVDKTADVWTEGARTVTGRLFGLPQVDLVPAVERYFDLVQRTVEINRRLAVRWAEAAGTLSGAVREKAESAGEVVREKAEAAGDIAREQAENAERAAREQAAKAEQAEKELARQARQAEREHARQVHARARARYEGLTKAELSDLLAKRDLPKTGNIDELIERLVEADSK